MNMMQYINNYLLNCCINLLVKIYNLNYRILINDEDNKITLSGAILISNLLQKPLNEFLKEYNKYLSDKA